MGHETLVNGFIERDLNAGIIIEPARRREKVKDALLHAVKTHSPSIAVKIGVGEGDLALLLASKVKRLIIVEPSFAAIERFNSVYGSSSEMKRIELVNGTFSALPLDYFKIDMVVVVDYLDLADSYRAVDEIGRALRFEGILFFGGVVLSDDDVEGIYDEFIHSLNPFHNDYYLKTDLDTFMKLKDFTLIDSRNFKTKLHLPEWLSAWKNYASDGSDENKGRSVLSANEDAFRSLYHWNGSDELDEIYCTAVFRKNKYSETEAKSQR
jgi:ubiquinone/menaquinone biosynthesis C-methylase UbiE